MSIDIEIKPIDVITGVSVPTPQRGALIVTIGLPASGKSTWAEEQRAKFPDRVRIVNRDDIRASNRTVHEQGDEGYVLLVRDFMIDELLKKGYVVICSDTNLTPKVRRRLSQIAKHRKAEYHEKSFTDVSLETCLERNKIRWQHGDRKVPDSAIIRMHEQLTNQQKEQTNA